MVTPLVSIIIPCYNSAPWLAAAIDSALAQTWQEKEVIVVDDGSTDDSRSILESYESSLSAVLFQENRGAAEARNSGLRRARGEFIQFLDSDDLLDPDKIRLQLERALRQEIPSQHIYSCSWARFYRTHDSADFRYDDLQRDVSPEEFLIESWEKNLMMHPAAWLVPRKLIQEAGVWDDSLSLNDDGEFFARVIARAKSIQYVKEAKSFYRSGLHKSLSGSKDWSSLFRSYEKSVASLFSISTSTKARHAAATLFKRFEYTCYPDAPGLREKAENYIKEYGGTELPPPGGPVFQLVSRLLGWKQATKIRKRISLQT